MANPKERHYWAQLRAALTAGQWHSPHPAKAPNWSVLPWSELFRKFNKHCKGCLDVTEIAQKTQALGALLTDEKDYDGDGDVLGNMLDPQLSVGQECVLDKSRRKNALQGFEALKTLNTNYTDSLNCALAYYAYALDDPAQCLDYVSKVSDMLAIQARIPIPVSASDPSRSSSAVLAPHMETPVSSIAASFVSASGSDSFVPASEIRDGRAWAMIESFRSICLQGMANEQLHPTSPEMALSAYANALPLFNILTSEFNINASIPPSTLPASSTTTLQLQVHHQSPNPTHHTTSIPTQIHAGVGTLDFTSFSNLREMWRWVERLLWRAIVLGARICDVYSNGYVSSQDRGQPLSSKQNLPFATNSLWTWIHHYESLSASWPSAFRTAHRSAVSVIALRAYVLRYNAFRPSSFVPAPSETNGVAENVDKPKAESQTPIPSSSAVYPRKTRSTQQKWLHRARSLIQDYRAILSACTSFPRANERNLKVEEFVDLSVAVWEAAGADSMDTGWVIDILWWATSLTSNSPRIYRHLTRLLHLSGSTSLALRTLKVYIQVVEKAYQAKKEGMSEEDVDNDTKWVEMCVFGVRMICRCIAVNEGIWGGSGGQGRGEDSEGSGESIEDLRYVGTLIEKARTRLNKGDKLLVACVLLAEGIWHSVIALKEDDPYTRPQHLDMAHSCFLHSIEVQPTSSAYYHLALSFARSRALYLEPQPKSPHESSTFQSPPESLLQRNPQSEAPLSSFRDLDSAIEAAGLALQADPREIRYWHLLGLLLSAKEKWEEAREILERGTEVAEGWDDEDDGEDGEDGEEDHESVENITILASDTTRANGNSQGVKVETSRQSHPLQEPVYVLGLQPENLPPSSGLLRSTLEKCPPSKRDVYEHSLRLRMTQAALTEVMEGPEGAEVKWVEVFVWVAEKRKAREGISDASHDHRISLDSGIPPNIESEEQKVLSTEVNLMGSRLDPEATQPFQSGGTDNHAQEIIAPIPITISPATPDVEKLHHDTSMPQSQQEHQFQDGEFEGKDREGWNISKDKNKTLKVNGLRMKRSLSIEGDRDTTKSKKVQQVQRMLKNHVHKGHEKISAVSKKIGHGMTKHQRHLHLRRTRSTPADFHEVIRNASFQASSIHSRSRRRLSSFIAFTDDSTDRPSPSPPPPNASISKEPVKLTGRAARENRLLSDLWLMSAATFRRLGKIEQAKGAIQEAEIRDEDNPRVWVQLGLYYFALGHYQHAIDSLQKGLFISPEDVSVTVHLCRLYLTAPLKASHSQSPASPPPSDSRDSAYGSSASEKPDPKNVDLAASLLSYLTEGRGWDVPEAWYFLAKAYGLQGRDEKQKEALRIALELSKGRGVREIGTAVGWCI